MGKICKQQNANCWIPKIYKSEELRGEKEYLEKLVSLVSTEKQKDWVSRFQSSDNVQQIAAWFEIMLYGWLIEIGGVDYVDPEPDILGNKPDFTLKVKDNIVIIEAKTVPMNNEERERRKLPQYDYGPIDPEPLKRALHRKAGQHKKIRDAGYRYVIALYPEDFDLFPPVVADALFGNLIFGDDYNTLSTNRRGELFRGNDYELTSLSGILVFKAEWDYHKKRRILKSSYIQNPFARIRIEPDIFPVDSRFIIIEEDVSHISMGWQPATNRHGGNQTT